MRMWRINPALLCDQHLRGAHLETHMIPAKISNDTNLGKFITFGLIETGALMDEHKALEIEMRARGYNCNSPLAYEDKLGAGKVSSFFSFYSLTQIKKCPGCIERMGNGEWVDVSSIPDGLKYIGEKHGPEEAARARAFAVRIFGYLEPPRHAQSGSLCPFRGSTQKNSPQTTSKTTAFEQFNWR